MFKEIIILLSDIEYYIFHVKDISFEESLKQIVIIAYAILIKVTFSLNLFWLLWLQF